MARKSKASVPTLFSPRCPECGEILALTPSGYLACPMGHGKLIVDDVEPLDHSTTPDLFTSLEPS